jgi:hypothetical protein
LKGKALVHQLLELSVHLLLLLMPVVRTGRLLYHDSLVPVTFPHCIHGLDFVFLPHRSHQFPNDQLDQVSVVLNGLLPKRKTFLFLLQLILQTDVLFQDLGQVFVELVVLLLQLVVFVHLSLKFQLVGLQLFLQRLDPLLCLFADGVDYTFS